MPGSSESPTHNRAWMEFISEVPEDMNGLIALLDERMER
jgi:hypothetical protein